MKKRSHMLLIVILTVAAILSMATVTNATEHEHEWELQGGAERGHGLKCNICGAYTSEAHTLDSNNICTVCSYEVHEHNYQCESREYMFHTMVCHGCGDKKTTTHSFYGTQTCSVCGYTEHTHIWEFNGETYQDKHGAQCTQCDTTSTQSCTFGSDGTCTVCGQSPAHWHEYEKAKRHSDSRYAERYHLLVCECGETSQEEHRMLGWDGKIRTDIMHSVVCGICGQQIVQGHMFSNAYVDGEVCVLCGYETVKHTWKYNDSYDNESHEMICTDCNKTKFEAHNPNSKGNCSVCGYHVYDVKEPDPKPVETKPAATKPAESKPAEPKPTETTPDDPIASIPAETQPEETVPAETPPVETTAIATAPATSDMTGEPPEKDETQHDGSLWIWTGVAVIVLGGLGAAVIIWKKKA